MSKEKHLPCEICGSTSDEYLYTYVTIETLVEEEVCINCLKSRKEFDKLKAEFNVA